MTIREKVLPDGTTKVHLFLDPSQTLNEAIIIPRYQIPTVQVILPRLAGKKHKTFSIFDALDGFTQVVLTDDSSLLTTVHTSWDRYYWLRLPHGISCAPEEFQLRMHETLESLQDVYCVADDILVVRQGNTVEETNRNHDLNVLPLMNNEDKNLKFNPEKIQFKLSKITFIGHVISDLGVKADPSKVKAISDMPPPTDKQGVMHFCGMVKYLNTLCPNLSQVIKPLLYLRKQDREFIWLDVHKEAFAKAKHLIASAPCVALITKGQLLSKWMRHKEGLREPFSNLKIPEIFNQWLTHSASSALTENCGLKLSLAIVSACDRWDPWIYGSEVNVHTDH